MPEKKTIQLAREDARESNSPSAQAGEFVLEEMHHIREGKHGAASPQQAIAIGLSKERRAGVELQPQRRGQSAGTKERAQRDYRERESHTPRKASTRRSRATSQALKPKGHSAASQASLSRQGKTAARKQGSTARHNAAMKASRLRKRAKRGTR